MHSYFGDTTLDEHGFGIGIGTPRASGGLSAQASRRPAGVAFRGHRRLHAAQARARRAQRTPTPWKKVEAASGRRDINWSDRIIICREVSAPGFYTRADSAFGG